MDVCVVDHPLVAARLGLPAPLSVAVLLVMLAAGRVVAVGVPGVMKVCTVPQAVPIELAAIAQ